MAALVNLFVLPQYSGNALVEVVADCLQDSAVLVDQVIMKFLEDTNGNKVSKKKIQYR